MTLVAYAWAASLLGAALFFLAGALWARRRAPSPTPRVDAREREVELELQLAHAREDALRAAAETERRAAAERQAASDAQRAAAERERLAGDLRAARTDRERLAADLRAARSENERLAGELRAARVELEPIARKARHEEDRAMVRERALVAVQTERQKLATDLEQARGRVAAAEAELAATAARLSDAEQRASFPPDAATEALRHEVVLAEERVRARDAQVERLQDENARLRLVERELEQVRREAVALADEVRSLRSAAFAARPPARFPRATPVPSQGGRGNALQAIVDREAENDRVQSAVIADELGLVVVSTGEYGDALAAFGAYLKDVGARTREVLPLNEVCLVTVRDDRDVTLSVRPIEAGADTNLALVTLAVGQGEETKR